MDDRIPWLRGQLEAEKADAEYNAGMSVDAGWNPDRVKEHVRVCLRIVDVCEEDLRQRGSGAMGGRVDRPTWDVLAALVSSFEHRPGYHERWGG